MAEAEDTSPLLIKVTPFGWEAVPRTIPPTPRDEFLLAEIKLVGGIDLSVPPGLYLFNVSREGNHVALMPYVHKKKWLNK